MRVRPPLFRGAALEFYARRDIYEHRGASRYTKAGEDEGAKARDALAARAISEVEDV